MSKPNRFLSTNISAALVLISPIQGMLCGARAAESSTEIKSRYTWRIPKLARQLNMQYPQLKGGRPPDFAVTFFTESPRSLRYTFLLVFVLLIGCSKSEPIKFTESQGQYIGVWQFLYESRTESGFDIKNILLEINADSTAVYRQCIVSKTVSEKSTNSSTRKGSMPNAIIAGLEDNEITLEQGTDFLPIGAIYMN